MKIRLIKKIAITCLVFSCGIVNSFSIPVHAETSTSTSCDLSEVETIAKNAPQFILGSDKIQWSDVDVVNSKPLYDFNDKLVAYSLDLKSDIDNEDAFVIISTSQEDEPILEFGVNQQSPYDKVTDNQTCIFDGFQGYYSHGKKTSKYHDILKNKDLENEEVKLYTDNTKNKKYVSTKPNNAKHNRLTLKYNKTKDSNYLTETTSSAVTASLPATVSSSATVSEAPVTNTSKELSGVPDYYWYHGCSPTAAAMVLKYDYPSKLSQFTQYTLTDALVSTMHTTLPEGATSIPNLAIGIEQFMSSQGVKVSAFNYGARSNATFDKAVSEIESNRPFVATLIGSTETSPSYPASYGGFGNHSMACIGYDITTSTDSSGVTTTNHYIIVHDTGSDGSVYCDYDSSALGTPTWTTVF